MPDMPTGSYSSNPDEFSGIFDDFPLDADLRELYLRLRLDGAIWRSQQSEDDSRLLAYAVELAAEAPAIITTPIFDEPRPAPVTRDLRERRRRGFLGDVHVAIVAALIVALVSVTLLQISPLALRSKAPGGVGATPQPTVTMTATPTATPAPTATRTPRPQPTAIPIVAFAPYIVRYTETPMKNYQATKCSPDMLQFEVLLKFTHSAGGTFNYVWRLYDGATLQPAGTSGGNYLTIYSRTAGYAYVTRSEALQSATSQIFDLFLNFTQPSQYSSKPRWGAQFVITKVDGKTLAKPIASPILELSTPAC